MFELLQTLQDSDYAMWIKEHSTAYTFFLAFHTIGLAFLVGVSGTTAMRILGVAKSIPLAAMSEFFPLMFAGAWINVATGLVLLSLYPLDYSKNPIIYIKLAFILMAVVLLRALRATVFGPGVDAEAAAKTSRARTLSWSMLATWIVATFCGRVVAYQWPTRIQSAVAVVAFFLVAGVLGYALGRSMGWIKPSPAN